MNPGGQMDVPQWQQQAARMVEQQIRNRGIRESSVLRAMESIPRHIFVPHVDARHAYDDAPVQIGFSQTISQPYIVAYMTELLELSSTHRVLEVGTGSGYQTAVLARVAAEVFTVDIYPDLIREAEQRLQSLEFTNIRYEVRDGHLGWPEFAPFDRIL